MKSALALAPALAPTLALGLLAGCAQNVTLDAAAPIDADLDSRPSVEVAQCEAAVQAMISACSGSAHSAARRLCVERAYLAACASGRAQVITAIAECLASSPCESASAPGADAACVARIVMENEGPAQIALNRAWCTCSPTETGCPGVPTITSSETTMLSDVDAQRVTECLGGCAMPSFCIGITTLGAAIHMCDMIAP